MHDLDGVDRATAVRTRRRPVGRTSPLSLAALSLIQRVGRGSPLRALVAPEDIVSLDRRVRRLEHQPTSDAELRDRVEELCRAHDWSVDGFLGDLKRTQAMSPAAFRRYATAMLADAGDLPSLGATCEQHGGPRCDEAMHALIAECHR